MDLSFPSKERTPTAPTKRPLANGVRDELVDPNRHDSPGPNGLRLRPAPASGRKAMHKTTSASAGWSRGCLLPRDLTRIPAECSLCGPQT